MKEKRHHHACGTINFDTFLIAGGIDQFGDALESVELFSLSTLEWKEGPGMEFKVVKVDLEGS